MRQKVVSITPCLHGSELFERAAWGQSGRQDVQAPLRRDVQAMGEEGDEDVCFDSLFILVEDRTGREIALESFEDFCDCHELQIVGPKLGGVVLDESGAEQIAVLAPARDPQLVAIQPIAEGSAARRHRDLDQAPWRGHLSRGAELHEKLFAGDAHWE